MSEASGATPSRPPPRLFAQIALRLVAVTAAFAVLEILIVFALYIGDPETLSEDLVSMQAARVAAIVREHGYEPLPAQLSGGSPALAVAIYDQRGSPLLISNPAHWPLPRAPLGDLQSATTREMHGSLFFLSGIRRADIDGRPVGISIAISGRGLRPFLPALYKEVRDHVLVPLIPLAALLLLLNVIVVRRMLAPLERAMADANALDPAQPSHRLNLPDAPLEVVTLLRSINRALDRLEHAIVALRQFTADVAHEVRTPLATMMLTIERLPASAERSQLIHDATAMRRVISQMLDLARIEAPQDVRSARTDLAEMASRVARDLTPLAIDMGKAIRYSDEGSTVVAGRADLLERALRNVAENALTHAPAGSEVEIIVGPQPEIRVLDHGPGIPQELRERAFERFWRIDRKREGAGLGLAIVRRIMEACGGAVMIGDTPGGGATVTLSCARAPSEDKEIAPSLSAASVVGRIRSS